MENNLLNTSYYPLDKIHTEFLKYAPAYAQNEARQAIFKIQELKNQGLIHHGVFYIVLADLIGSTKYSAAYGNEKASKRIENFITSSFNALNDAKISNIGLFVKEIGDAVLFIFQHFPDILRWKASFNKCLSLFQSDEPIHVRTCIHIGEVYLDGVNPLSLAVSQTFKMEKIVKPDDIVLTYPAYVVAWPTIARAHHGFQDYGAVELDGFKEPVSLHKLIIHDNNDTERITLE